MKSQPSFTTGGSPERGPVQRLGLSDRPGGLPLLQEQRQRSRERTQDEQVLGAPARDQAISLLPVKSLSQTAETDENELSPRRQTVTEARSISNYLAARRERPRPSLDEQKTKKWNYRDSPLVGPGEKPYDLHFRGVLPYPKQDLKTYIEEVVGERAGEAIGVDLGGPGSALFAQFPDGFFKRTIGITLHDDFRDKATQRRDAARNHTVFQGSIFDPRVQQMVGDVAPEGVDVQFERMVGAHRDLPDDPLFMMDQSNNWYRRLRSENGVQFTQAPYAFQDTSIIHMTASLRRLIPRWKELIDREYAGRLEIQTNYSAIRVRTLQNAPDQLPRLSAREFLAEEKDALARRRAQLQEMSENRRLPANVLAERVAAYRREHLL